MVFHAPGSEKVKEKIVETGAVLLRAKAAADYSDEDLETVAIFRSLKKFNRAGFPTNVVYPSDPSLRPILLPEFLTQDKVIRALTLAGSKL